MDDVLSSNNQNQIVEGSIYVALGANQAFSNNSPQKNLNLALEHIAALGITILKSSRIWRSIAWPDPSDPQFANGVVEVSTQLPPDVLMNELHQIEKAFGRERHERNAPRTMDLDLIDYHGKILHGALELPHPRATQRGFVLCPLKDIAPDWTDPVSGRTLDELISRLPCDQVEGVTPTDKTLIRPA